MCSSCNIMLNWPRNHKNKIRVMERKRSCRFHLIFTVAFGRLFYVRLGNVNDCPAGLEPSAWARNRRKLLWNYDETRNFVFFPLTPKFFQIFFFKIGSILFVMDVGFWNCYAFNIIPFYYSNHYERFGMHRMLIK